MSFSWSRYESLLNDPEPGTSVWDYEIEEEPEPEYERCADCGEDTEEALNFDLVPYDLYCFARWLCGDNEMPMKESESFSAVGAAVA